MSAPNASSTAFIGDRQLCSGALVDVALAVKAALAGSAHDPILVFDDATGRVVDLDLRGSDEDVIARLEPQAPDEDPALGPRGRGRPRLGVIGREVTLLPRHWDWLAAQPGGASVVLRKLVDEARRTGAAAQRTREAHDRAYRFMSALAGDFPGFEEATRALFAGDRARLERYVSSWPEDVRDYALKLADEDRSFSA